MERLNESQLRAHALKMFEENYSYTVTAKKLSCNKGWVSKWTRHWKTNPADSSQSQSRRRLTNKTALNLTARRIIFNSKYDTFYSTGRLASKFARFVSAWKHLEHYGCSCLCQPIATDTDGTRTSSSEILEINFFYHSVKSHQLMPETEGSHQKQRRHCSILIFSLHTVFK